MVDDFGTLDYTGERMVPEKAAGQTFWEHVGRYRYASPFVKGKRVLDIACGEGYGAAALREAGAASVIGVDLSAEACEHARRKYGLDARVGDALQIPLADNSLDLVVSFETIEHVSNPERFLEECARVLVSEGILIVSTPNRPVYSGQGSHNPFHHREYDEGEFRSLLETRFASVSLYSQFPRSAAWWSPRSLAAEQSHWLRLKGFWRLSSWLCPPRRTEVPPSLRQNPTNAILGQGLAWSSWLNPYQVRPCVPRSREQPYYFVAEARGVKKTQ